MKLKIAVLEDIHKSGIEELNNLAQVQLGLGWTRRKILDECGNWDGIIVRSVIEVDKELMGASKKLKFIGRAGTGIENIDVNYAGQRNIHVFTTPTANTVSAAEYTIAQILCLTRNLYEAQKMVREGDFRRSLLEGRELSQLTIGILGLGNVGIEVAKMLSVFKSRLLAYDPYTKHKQSFKNLSGIIVKSFPEFLKCLDVLTIHVRLTDKTENMLNLKAFEQMKDGILLVNSSRAKVIENSALLNALEQNKVKMAALDVLSPEPPYDESPNNFKYHHELLNHKDIFLTPHIGGSTSDAQKKVSNELLYQIKNYVNNQ